MENEDRIAELEAENRRLQEQLDKHEKIQAMHRAARHRLVRFATRTFTGKTLHESVTRLVDDVIERRLNRETIRDVAYATLRRLTRVGTVTLLLAMAPLTLALLQTYYLKKQNEKFDIQNRRIDQQTYLQEAERRGSLVFLFDNVLDRMDEELRRDPVRRELSPQIIGRIAALSKSLKPYRYLENDTITSRPSSPERGQLLLSLLASKLGRNTYDQIFLLCDFSYATLERVNLDGAYLRNANLSHAILDAVSLGGADLRNVNFEDAELTDVHAFVSGPKPRAANLDFANFHRARVNGADFSNCSFEYANFSEASLRRVVFRSAIFHQTNLSLGSADTLDFSQSTLLGIRLGLASKSSASLHSFELYGLQTDTASYAQLHALGLPGLPPLDYEHPHFRITRDTFYVEDRKPVVVEDSVVVFSTLSKK